MEIFGNTEDGGYMLMHGAMNPYMVLHFHQWYRLLTSTFMHFGIEHLMNNMLLLFLLGQIFEEAVGTTRFFAIYLGSGIAGSFLSFLYQSLMGLNDIVAGASGAIFGIVGGMIIVIIVNKGKYKGISSKRMFLMAILTLYFGFTTAGTDNVGHVGGIIAGIIFTFILYGIPTIIKNSHIDLNDENLYTIDNKQDKEGQ
ncbi:MAG: rhomboid family intramembrane serine protease [Pseudobutyrivibrio sp.]|nr:rhomboid family intramembrane serine protease [Pseudobutyrivibrio sp.]